jgi:hypothetical protein
MVQRVIYKIAGKELILETGRIAKQTNGAVYASGPAPELMWDPTVKAAYSGGRLMNGNLSLRAKKDPPEAGLLVSGELVQFFVWTKVRETNKR